MTNKTPAIPGYMSNEDSIPFQELVQRYLKLNHRYLSAAAEVRESNTNGVELAGLMDELTVVVEELRIKRELGLG